MFIQIIQGKCTRPDELRAMATSWREDVSEGAVGWLGGTYGFTDDDQFLGVIRFESREAAMANSARPEQGAWAEKLMSLMDGPVTFHDCDDVTLFMDGGSDVGAGCRSAVLLPPRVGVRGRWRRQACEEGGRRADEQRRTRCVV